MKILRCDGRTLDVYDARLIMRLRAGPAPIRAHGTRVLDEDEAREILKQALREGATKEGEPR
jgi:plasmid stability protein